MRIKKGRRLSDTIDKIRHLQNQRKNKVNDSGRNGLHGFNASTFQYEDSSGHGSLNDTSSEDDEIDVVNV